MSEQWRPVIGYESFYQVSDWGRIRSLITGKILRPAGANRGMHLHVVLARPNVTRTVHSVVAEVFIGQRPQGFEVRHRNGNPADNRLENLEYGTRSENAEDSKRHGTHFHAGLDRCKRGHRLTPENLQKHDTATRRTCLACRRERDVIYRRGDQLIPEGHCPHGHPKTPENRYTNGIGKSRCKPCANDRNRTRKEKEYV